MIKNIPLFRVGGLHIITNMLRANNYRNISVYINNTLFYHDGNTKYRKHKNTTEKLSNSLTRYYLLIKPDNQHYEASVV